MEEMVGNVQLLNYRYHNRNIPAASGNISEFFEEKKYRNYGFFLAPDKFQHEIQETTNQGPTMRLQLCPSFPTRTRTE